MVGLEWCPCCVYRFLERIKQEDESGGRNCNRSRKNNYMNNTIS